MICGTSGYKLLDAIFDAELKAVELFIFEQNTTIQQAINDLEKSLGNGGKSMKTI